MHILKAYSGDDIWRLDPSAKTLNKNAKIDLRVLRVSFYLHINCCFLN